MNAYREKLANPRWQRRRTEIMQRANFACEVCGDDNQELHVHHVEYRREYRNPWEYPDNLLRCLCSDCHTLAHIPRHKVCAYVEPDKAQRVQRQAAIEDAAHKMSHELQSAIEAVCSDRTSTSEEIGKICHDRHLLHKVIQDRQRLLIDWVKNRAPETEAAMHRMISNP